jgi:hypothetical protein
VTIPQGAVILRLHKPIEGPDEKPSDFGDWWFTPYQLRAICDKNGNARNLIVGRADANSPIHRALALLGEWYRDSKNQLSYLNVVRLTEPLLACYGPGTVASSKDGRREIHPELMHNGKPARQIYIHNCSEYQSAFQRLVVPNASTDVLFGATEVLPHQYMNAPMSSFEF